MHFPLYSSVVRAGKIFVSGLVSSLFIIGCGGGGEETGGLSANAATSATVPSTSNSTVTSAPSTPVVVTGGGQVSGCSSTGATGAIAVSNVPSRYSGVAPLAVFFDASATTASATTRPFHNLEYRWDFADTASGNWAYGSKAGTASRNTATGPVAAHVFETPGTYRVGIAVTDGTNTVSNQCVEIAVQDPGLEFASAKTVCISRSGNFTGCPSGATQVTSSDADASVASYIGTGNKRILFRRGESFDVSTPIRIAQNGSGMVGAFGSGAKPVMNLIADAAAFSLSSITTPNISDWRFIDMTIQGNDLPGASAGFSGGGSINNTLFARIDVKNVKFGWSFSTSTLNGINNSGFTSPEWDGMFIIDSTVKTLVGADNGSNGMYVCAKRLAIMGNHVDPDQRGEHGIRTCHTDRGVYAHNTIEDIISGRAFLSIRSPDQGSSTLLGVVYTEKIYVSDNHFFGGNTNGMAGTGPTNQGSTGRIRTQIWERNLFQGSSATTGYLTLLGEDISVRNNIFFMPQGDAITGQPLDASPNPTNINIYNNSFYFSGSGNGSVLSLVGGSMTGSTYTVQNNLYYTPGGTTYGSLVTNATGATVTMCTSCNTANAEIRTSPNLTANPPSTAAHFKPLAGSYVIGRGMAVPVWSDYFGVPTSSTRTIGAVLQ